MAFHLSKPDSFQRMSRARTGSSRAHSAKTERSVIRCKRGNLRCKLGNFSAQRGQHIRLLEQRDTTDAAPFTAGRGNI
jgi:hypothetical protein